MEQLVILLLIGLISFVNWLIRQSAELRKKKQAEQRSQEGGAPLRPRPERPVAESQDDPSASMRRLMEALGLPDESEPPPVPKRTVQPEASMPPPLPRPQAEAPRQTQVRTRTFQAPPAYAPPIPSVPAMPEPTSARRRTAPKVEAAPAVPSKFRELLASPTGLRDAIVLSEILGTPKGIRS